MDLNLDLWRKDGHLYHLAINSVECFGTRFIEFSLLPLSCEFGR